MTEIEKKLKYNLKSFELSPNFYGYKMMFKCLAGTITESGKFLMSLNDKLTKEESYHRCDRIEFAIRPYLVYLRKAYDC